MDYVIHYATANNTYSHMHNVSQALFFLFIGRKKTVLKGIGELMAAALAEVALALAGVPEFERGRNPIRILHREAHWTIKPLDADRFDHVPADGVQRFEPGEVVEVHLRRPSSIFRCRSAFSFAVSSAPLRRCWTCLAAGLRRSKASSK